MVSLLTDGEELPQVGLQGSIFGVILKVDIEVAGERRWYRC